MITQVTTCSWIRRRYSQILWSTILEAMMSSLLTQWRIAWKMDNEENEAFKKKRFHQRERMNDWRRPRIRGAQLTQCLKQEPPDSCSDAISCRGTFKNLMYATQFPFFIILFSSFYLLCDNNKKQYLKEPTLVSKREKKEKREEIMNERELTLDSLDRNIEFSSRVIYNEALGMKEDHDHHDKIKKKQNKGGRW